MGGCFSSSNDAGNGRGESSDGTVGSMPIGRNQPLKKESPKWKSDVPLTSGQLRSKRDEFWETAPCYEGRKEIWDALLGAATALETNDFDLAQAIVDGASITCPSGSLTDCYDELGNRYILPVYCLSPPINMVDDNSESDATGAECDPEGGVEAILKLRLSLGKEIKLSVRSTDTVLHVKRRLQQTEGIDPHHQRWFYSGKLLTDKIKIEEIKIPKGFIIQVIVSQANPTPVDA
ncbi:ubiquitin domain-containing protein 2-like isoform X1 [Antedon mediterranea]|uniref:ubiquitin domain-containing protein 2-like isoform X1 n=1 Tax=Antedon mediterranea TaxID=105859 RepID=UPI003AF6F774